MPRNTLTLEQARQLNCLDEFIAQQERWMAAQGFDAADETETEALLEALATAPKPEDRT